MAESCSITTSRLVTRAGTGAETVIVPSRYQSTVLAAASWLSSQMPSRVLQTMIETHTTLNDIVSVMA